MSIDSVGYIPPASQFDTYLFKFQVITYIIVNNNFIKDL